MVTAISVWEDGYVGRATWPESKGMAWNGRHIKSGLYHWPAVCPGGGDVTPCVTGTQFLSSSSRARVVGQQVELCTVSFHMGELN